MTLSRYPFLSAARTFALAVLLVLPGLVGAQNLLDAKRFSESMPTGTARSLGLSGAMTAAGADYANASINPAGMALYTKSELQLTTAVQFFGTRADYLGGTGTDVSLNLSIPSFGIAIHSETGRSSGLKGSTFYLGVNQTAQYRRRFTVAGYNDYNSITNWYADDLDGFEPINIPQGEPANGYISPTLPGDLAFHTYFQVIQEEGGEPVPYGIIDFIPNAQAPEYQGAFQYGDIEQEIQITEKGRTLEWNLGWAGNISDRLYFGGGLGITDIRFIRESRFTETDARNNYDAVTDERLDIRLVEETSFLKTSGVGVNGRFGLIAQPISQLRIGLAVVTPTMNWMTDEEFTRDMRLESDRAETASLQSGIYEGDYRITTPFEVNAGVFFLLGKSGFITADAGIRDYSIVSFAGDGAFGSSSNFSQINREIAEYLTVAPFARVGVEARTSDNLYFRGGFAYYGSPYTEDAASYIDLSQPGLRQQEIDGAQYSGSVGLGYRDDEFFIDFAYVHQVRTSTYRPYTQSATNSFDDRALSRLPYNRDEPESVYAPVAKVRRTFGNIVFSFGFFLE